MQKKKYPAVKWKRFSRLTILVQKAFEFLRPDPVTWEGAGWGLAILAVILVSLKAVLLLKNTGIIAAGIILLLIFGTSILAATGIFYGVKLINSIPEFYRLILFASGVLLLTTWEGNVPAKIMLVVSSVLLGSVLGGVIRVLQVRKWKMLAASKKVGNGVVLALAGSGLVFGFYWLSVDGFTSDPPANPSLMTHYRPPHISLPDPSLDGNYRVCKLSYGSGRDKHRPEYGKEVTIRTVSVNGERYVGNWEKLHGWIRTRFWGFDEKSLPLNARVWYPEGKGPFPLVLIVHGNHADRDFSDPGYAYMGKLMASRGFIFASVDQNFLNTAWYDLFDHLREENDCRAWLLLKHLELWREWNKDPENPFYRKVDLDNIGLIGHSRGGEAVAAAACLNPLPHHPDDATIDYDFNFNLRTVISIAPVDGQYRPAGTGTRLEDINYFVVHGSNDMDLRTYEGSRQYQRIDFKGGDHFVKAGLYIFGANHGQFNTRWGRNDNAYPLMALFNKRQIMPKEDQEKIAKVFFSAFLEATLRGKKAYLDLFRDYRSGLDWLPETVYLNQYEDPACNFICTFEEDINVLTTTRDGGEICSENLTVWKEKLVPLKWNNQATRAVYAGWNLEENDSLPGSLIIRQPGDNRIPTGSHSCLYFVMADANENPNPYPSEKAEGEEETEKHSNNNMPGKNEKKKEPIDLTIVLVDSAGRSAALPLSSYSYLSRQLEPKLMKADFMTDVSKSDLVFQVFFYPLTSFKKDNEDFDTGRISEVRFLFDRTEKGVVVIDNIGFWEIQENAAY